MSSFLSKGRETGVAGGPAHFDHTDVPCVEADGENPTRGRELATEGPAADAATVTRTDTLSSLEHHFNDKTGCLDHDCQDSLVPDARANMTPSDMVTRRLEGLLGHP